MSVKNPRRAFYWERIRGPRKMAALFIGTAGGAGLLPFAPGTFGTLVGIPLAYWTSEWDLAARVAFWLALTIAGSWACMVFDETMGSHDNQNLVMDEVVGVGITAWPLLASSATVVHWLAAFVLFRLFDILKPPPVRWVDTWSKSGTGWLGGFGVMADDLVAGVQGLIAMLVLLHFKII